MEGKWRHDCLINTLESTIENCNTFTINHPKNWLHLRSLILTLEKFIATDDESLHWKSSNRLESPRTPRWVVKGMFLLCRLNILRDKWVQTEVPIIQPKTKMQNHKKTLGKPLQISVHLLQDFILWKWFHLAILYMFPCYSVYKYTTQNKFIKWKVSTSPNKKLDTWHPARCNRYQLIIRRSKLRNLNTSQLLGPRCVGFIPGIICNHPSPPPEASHTKSTKTSLAPEVPRNAKTTQFNWKWWRFRPQISGWWLNSNRIF